MIIENNCPECNSFNLKMTWETMIFPYLDKQGTIELSTPVPVWSCLDCNFKFTNSDADNLCDLEIENHLNK